VLLQNGMIDLARIVQGNPPKLLGFDHDWFTTSQLPYDFDPAAKCQKFKAFLHRILEIDPKTKKPRRTDDKRMKLLQEFFGYCLLNSARFQKFLVMIGEGCKRKGVSS